MKQIIRSVQFRIFARVIILLAGAFVFAQGDLLVRGGTVIVLVILWRLTGRVSEKPALSNENSPTNGDNRDSAPIEL